MKKIKRIFLSLIYVIVGFFTSLTSFAAISGISSIEMYGVPYPMYGVPPPTPPNPTPTPTLIEVISKKFIFLLAIPLILIIGIVVFIVKERKNKKNSNNDTNPS